MNYIKKRSGDLVPFDSNKIKNAISKAFFSCQKEISDEELDAIVNKISVYDGKEVEKIQDDIEDYLIYSGHPGVAKSFIRYRERKRLLRAEVQKNLDFIKKYKESDNTANATIDDNANVSNKNMAVLNAEIHKPANKETNLRLLREKIHELYPDFDYKQMDIDFNTIMHLHDASSQIGLPYCASISLYPFILNGIKEIGGLSSAPKNIDSFCGMFVNMLFAVTSFLKGACATPGLFQTMDWYLRKRYGDDYINHLDENVLSGSVEKRTLESQIDQWFQQITYSINQPSAARGAQSLFHNLSIFDQNFFDGMYSEFYYPDGTKPIWETFNWLQKHYLHWLNQERLRCMLTFPVVSVALIYKDGEFADKEMADFVAQEYAEGNSFFTYISDTSDSLSSCCRLRSQVKDNTFSFTNGQIGEQTGSLNVITLDLNRIVQDWWPAHAQNYSQDRCQPDKRLNTDEDKNSLKEYLITILDRVYKYQIAYKHILVSLKEAGLLPIYDAGFIDMSRQYLTIGVNGVSAAAEWLGIKCNNNDQYADFCHLIFGTIKEQNTLHKTKDTMFNTEFTPCESAAIKLYERDKHNGYWVPKDVNLYTSYVYKPNDPNISVLDKFTMHGDKFLGEYCDGGQAAHINLDSHLSKTQYSMLLEHAGKVGCKYFTFNIPNCECEDCGFIAKHPFEVCPKCGSTNVSLWDRIIGYLTKIKNWSRGRQIEQKKRVYSNLNKC